jgi:hypothetical protein
VEEKGCDGTAAGLEGDEDEEERCRPIRMIKWWMDERRTVGRTRRRERPA